MMIYFVSESFVTVLPFYLAVRLFEGESSGSMTYEDIQLFRFPRPEMLSQEEVMS